MSTNLSKVLGLLKGLYTDVVSSYLSYAGRHGDMELPQDLTTSAKLATKDCVQVYIFSRELHPDPRPPQ